MGIHYGMADDEEDKVARRMDYHGIHVIIAARVSALADGGQINITEAIRDAYLQIPEPERPDVVIHDLGMTHLKGLQNPEHLYVVYPKSLGDRHLFQAKEATEGENSPIPPSPRFGSRLSISSIPLTEEGSESEPGMPKATS